MSFGERVRVLRLGAGLSQGELAELAGISERTVSDIERGLRASVYAATARSLADALGVGPEQRHAFLLAAASRAPDAATAAAPPALPANYLARLPAPLTRLIGREADLAALAALLRGDDVRFITVVGAGGVGKTRFAVEGAHQWRDETGGTVHFVDLSGVRDATSVLSTVATRLGLPVTGRDVMPQLTDMLAEQRVLLVFDTMEHVLDAAPAVAELAAACPHLTVLATSRAPLKVRGEHQWPLGPLTVEQSNGAAASPAVELFLERARECMPGHPDDAETRAVVTEICSRLDGLPLAIELAAARTQRMSIGAVLASLDDRLGVLVDGRRDAPSRHRTMRAALEWSYALLSESQQATLRALSVFQGGATADAVDAVLVKSRAGSVGAAADLDALADASLLVVERDGPVSRFGLLDIVAAYATELAGVASEREALEQAHAQHFVSLSRSAAPHLRGAEQREWLARLHADEGNLRAAMTWAIDSRAPSVALGLAGALWMFWRRAGLFADARAWLDAALDIADPRSPDRLPVLWGAGWLAFHLGDYARTAAVAAEMTALAGAEQPLHRRNALTLAGNAALGAEAYADAVAHLRAALALCGETTDRWVRAASLLNLATALSAAGQFDEAVLLGGQAVTVFTSVGDRNFAARAQLALGYTALRRGEDALAAEHIGAAMEVIRELGDTWSEAEGLEAVSALRADDRPRDAAELAGAAEHARSLIAMLPHPADARVNAWRLGRARAALGDDSFAAAFQEGRAAPLGSMLQLATDLTCSAPS